MPGRDGWKTFHTGETLDRQCKIGFAPVTAQHVHLSIREAAKAPSMLEVQLFVPAKVVP